MHERGKDMFPGGSSPQRVPLAALLSEETRARSAANYRRLLGYVRPYARFMALAAIFLVLSSGLTLALPWVVRNLIDTVFVDRDAVLLTQVTIALLVVFLLSSVFSVGHTYLIAYVGERVIADLRQQLYTHLQRLSLPFYTAHRAGDLSSRLTNDVNVVQAAVTHNLITALSQVITLVGGVTIILLTDWRLTVLILVILPIVVLTARFFGQRIRHMSTVVQDRLAEVTAILQETTTAVRVVKSFAREDYEIQRFRQKVEDQFRAAMERAAVRSLLGPIVSLTVFGAVALVLWYGGHQVIEGTLTPGALVSILFYMMMVGGTIGGFTGLFSAFQEALGAMERVFQLLDTPPDIADQPDARPLPPIRGHVVFENVTFRYADRNEDVLFAINLEVQPGEVIAIVGPTGAGKSTLVDLIPRFYDPTAGRILIDGHDIRTVQIRSLRAQVGIVPQETLLFAATVRENIAYGRLDATQEEIEAAAKAANAHDFIMALPQGYDTLVGERGVKLSGGERQRVAIARALLKDPRILILDEATSSLDSASEALVQEALERLMRGRTTFVIAHRLSTVHNAHRIVVINEGRIVEQGSHEELMEHGGLYHQLYTMQFKTKAPTLKEETPVEVRPPTAGAPPTEEHPPLPSIGLPWLDG